MEVAPLAAAGNGVEYEVVERARAVHGTDPPSSLSSYMAVARVDGGSLSLRAIADRTDYSHTSIARVFSDDSASVSWPIVEQVALALGADTGTARQLWLEDSSIDGDRLRPGGHPQARLLATYIWCALLLTGGIAVAVMQAVDRNVSHTTFVTDLLQWLFGAGTCIALSRHVYEARKRHDQRSVIFFSWLTAGVALWTAGQTIWFVARNVWKQPIPTGHIHDVGYLLMPVCVGIALWIRASYLGMAGVHQWWHRALSLMCLLGAVYATTLFMLAALDLRVDGFELVAALYPATDITLACLAAVPLIFGYRIVGSVVLTTAFLAAAASDVGYLILKADPATDMLPAPAALGYIGFTAMLSLYAFLVRPLPGQPHRKPRRSSVAIPRTIIDGATAFATLVAVASTAGVLWISPSDTVRITATGIAFTATAALALRLVLPNRTPR